MNIRKSLIALLVLLATAACGVPEGTVIEGCTSSDKMRVVCGMQSPEDIAVVEGGDYLLLSELGDMGERAGRIVLFNVASEEFQAAYPFPSKPAKAPDNVQGSAECVTPPTAEMSPHGSHLVQLADGSWRYLVVNHGDREAVELFSVQRNEEDVPHLHWQGCVLPAENTLINDVVGLSNGDVVYTRMYRPDDFMGQQLGMLIKANTGDVWRWGRAKGLQLLPYTAGSLTNGIEVSADERFVFINQYMNEEVHKYDLEQQQLVGIAPVPNVDNSAWGPNGELWLASHTGEVSAMMKCFSDSLRTCGLAFEIVALNPDTMETRVVFQHQGPPMGAATVATPLGDNVYLGSFVGDRLAIVPLSHFK